MTQHEINHTKLTQGLTAFLLCQRKLLTWMGQPRTAEDFLDLFNCIGKSPQTQPCGNWSDNHFPTKYPPILNPGNTMNKVGKVELIT
jgi:hypothetical protein